MRMQSFGDWLIREVAASRMALISAYVDELPPPPKDATEARRTRAVTEDYRVPFSIYMDE